MTINGKDVEIESASDAKDARKSLLNKISIATIAQTVVILTPMITAGIFITDRMNSNSIRLDQHDRAIVQIQDSLSQFQQRSDSQQHDTQSSLNTIQSTLGRVAGWVDAQSVRSK